MNSDASLPMTIPDLAGAMNELLVRTAKSSTTARESYRVLLEECFRSHHRIPNAAQLVELVQHFNNTNRDGLKIPIGTASVPREARTQFLANLSKLNVERLPLKSLSPGTTARVAGMFDAIVDELHASLSEKLQSKYEEDLAGATSAFRAQEQKWISERSSLVDKLDEANADLDRTSNQVSILEARNSELVSSLDSLRRQHVEAEARYAAANATLRVKIERIDELENSNAELKTSEREERRARLLVLDSARQNELKLEKLGADYKALEADRVELARVLADRANALESANAKLKELEEVVASLQSRVPKGAGFHAAGAKRSVSPSRRPLSRKLRRK